MYSIDFPEMFSSNGTRLLKDNEATISNIKLLLASWKGSLFGDPYFGTKIKNFIYEQNNIVLKDLIIDDIYVSLTQFIPQINVKRTDIELIHNETSVYVNINCINKLDKEVNSYNILLISDDRFGGI